MPNLGKAGPAFMGVVYSNLGKKSHAFLVGPKKGEDNAVISLWGNRVMILTVDPVSMIPAVGVKLSAWMSVHLIASDYATSGLLPQYATFSFNFPPDLNLRDRERYITSIGTECQELGITIAAGHTGSYPGSDFTVIGAGSMFGFANRGEFVDPSMARPGDAILMTKEAAIEATASLASSFPRWVEAGVGRRAASSARGLIAKCSTVADSVTASRIGLGPHGVTSMHDATEGGVIGALSEMAHASGTAFGIMTKNIPVSREVAAVCNAFGLDPLRSLSEGTLLITCNQGSVGELTEELLDAGIPVAKIGSVRRGDGLWSDDGRGRLSPLSVGRDGYWDAYRKAVRRGLR